MPDLSEGVLEARSPSAVGLTRLSTRLSFPPGGRALYRSILRLVELPETGEFVIVPCGRGRGAVFLSEATGAGGAGADPDPVMVGVASERAKRAGLAGRVHFENAPLHELPYQDAVFDLALGEIEVAASSDPEAAVAELVRVTRPGGTVVLVQLVWTRAVEEARRSELIEHLGVRPRMLVEWKQILRDAGVVDLQVEDWSDRASSQDQPSLLGGLTQLFTVRGKLRILPRAWKRWGWRGVRAVLTRERELRRLLEEERVLGVVLMKGTRQAESKAEGEGEEHSE